MAHSRGSRFQKRSVRRAVSWSLGPSGIITAGDSAVALFGTAAAALLDDLTIVRVRGDLILNLTAAAGVNQGEEWAFGMCIVSENAAGIGVTAVPDPIGDIGWDGWFVYETGTLLARDATPLTDASGDNVIQRIKIDSKAMRKIHLTDVVVAVLGNAEIGGSSTMGGFLQSRMLAKLP